MPTSPEDDRINYLLKGLCPARLTGDRLDQDEPIMGVQVGNDNSGYIVNALGKDPNIGRDVPPNQRRCALTGTILPGGITTACNLCQRLLVIKPYLK